MLMSERHHQCDRSAEPKRRLCCIVLLACGLIGLVGLLLMHEEIGLLLMHEEK